MAAAIVERIGPARNENITNRADRQQLRAARRRRPDRPAMLAASRRLAVAIKWQCSGSHEPASGA